MALLTISNNYSDFKSIADSQHHKDVFYVTDGSTLFVSYIFSASGLVVASGNFVTEPVSFSADFPNAVELIGGMG